MSRNHFIILFFLLGNLVFFFGRAYKRNIQVTVRHLRFFVSAALIYMFAPTLLFFASLPGGIFIKVITGLVLTYYLTRSLGDIARKNIFYKESEYTIRLDFLLLFFGVLILSYSSLFCGEGFVPDWPKHRSVLLCLYSDPMNPAANYFELPAGDVFRNARLVYYYASYLPAAYAVKLLTVFLKISDVKNLADILSVFFFGWQMSGVVLAFLLLPAACKRLFAAYKEKINWECVFFVVLIFSGASYWYEAVRLQKIWVWHAEWAIPYNTAFPSFISHWQWSPQHLVPALLGVMLISLYAKELNRFPLLLWCAFLISHSVFVWMGMLPIGFYFFYKLVWEERGNIFAKRTSNFKKMVPEALAAGGAVFIVLLFYASKLYHDPLRINRDLAEPNGFLKYLLFVFLQLLPVWIIILPLHFLRKGFVPKVVWISISIVLLFALFEFSLYNMWLMRGGLFAFLIIAMFCGVVIQDNIRNGQGRMTFFAVMFFIITSAHFLNEYVMGLQISSELLERDRDAIMQYIGRTRPPGG